MAEKNIHSILRETFPSASIEKWQRAASQEIEGKDPFVELAWNNADEISLQPYYDQSDVAQLSYLDHFFPTPNENSFLGNREWLNCPLVSVSDENEANKISLNHLSSGADGIFFHVSRECEFRILLNDIQWQYCSLLFKSTDDRFDTRALKDFVRTSKMEDDAVTGALFWDIVPKKDIDTELLSWPKFKSLGLTVRSSTPAKEISSALSHSVHVLQASPDSITEKILRAFAFSFAAEKNIFDSIAKLRAFRMLWYQLICAYGKSDVANDPFIHFRCEPFVDSKYQPHGNMISSTTSAVSGILGGANAITVYPEDEKNTSMVRIARNVSSILREESHLNKVANPVNGSYALNMITNSLAERAWTHFQSTWKNENS